MIKNYKKSLLSVAAAAAIAATSLSAGYLPLTSDADDNEWVIFGVSGLKTDGAIATVPGAFTIVGAPNIAIDLATDEIETFNSSSLFSVKAITDTDVEVRIDTTTAPAAVLSASDPVRTIYIDTNGDGAPNFAVSYRSVLEGKKLEYSIGNGAANELTINFENVFANPIAGVEITGVPAIAGNELKSLTETDSAVDYDFNNNPPLSSEWTATTHRDPISSNNGGQLRVYSYDAPNSKWEIYDSRNTANDFTDITAAKAYWAKLESDTTVADTNAESGLVLGTPSLTTANYTNAGLSEGWNFISFDAINSEIRNAATGMLLTTSTSGAVADAWTITDSSGNHVIGIDSIGANDTSIVIAKEINNKIAVAKLEGRLPSTFELRAFPTATAQQVALIANKKFIVTDGAADELDAATTLTGAVLLDPVTLIATLNGADVENANGVMSVYGEYAMVVQPLYGAGTAQGLSNNPASISVTGATDTDLLPLGATATNAAIQGILDGDNDLTATEIDLGIDGTLEDVLIASTSPFTIRDHTFTRAFEFNTQGATDSTLNIVGGITVGPVTIPFAAANPSAIATAIDGAGGAATISADNDGVGTAGNIVIVTDTAGAAKFLVTESTADLLQVTTSSADLAKGAVKNVYSLNYLSKISTRNDIVIPVIAELPDNVADGVRIDVVSTLGVTMTGTNILPSNPVLVKDTLTNNTTFYTALVTQLNLDLAAANLTATATATVDDADLTNSFITISGPDVTSATYNLIVGGGGAETAVTPVADLGYIAAYSGDLAVDLQFNAILTPNYVMDGPLYTMRDNNMILKALLTGTTDLTDGSVSWESIDLTRKPSEWLDSQDYDLFDTDASAGYWAYLTPDASANPLSVTSSTLSKEYAHHFDQDDSTVPSVGTTTNEFSGNLEVIVAGLNPVDAYKSARVTATIGGETFELTQDALDKTKFTGSVSVHEAYGFNVNTPYEVVINIADGLGNNLREALTGNGAFDNVKPAAPGVTTVNGELTITTDPLDTVAGIYIFSGTPPEVGTEAAKQGFILGSGGVASAACSGAASAFDDPAGGITVVTVDSNGTLGSGNASDTTSVAFMPILISRALVTDTNNGGVIESSTAGTLFDATCTNIGAIPAITGVTLSAYTADTTVKLAYTSQGANANNDIPVTAYVSDGAASPTVAEIKYPVSYVGTDVFFELNGQVYGYQLKSEAALDALNGGAGNSDTTPEDLSAVLNNPKIGISL